MCLMLKFLVVAIAFFAFSEVMSPFSTSVNDLMSAGLVLAQDRKRGTSCGRG